MNQTTDFTSISTDIQTVELEMIKKIKKINFVNNARLTNVNYKTTEIVIFFMINPWHLDIREILSNIPENIYKIRQCNIHYSRHTIKITLKYK